MRVTSPSCVNHGDIQSIHEWHLDPHPRPISRQERRKFVTRNPPGAYSRSFAFIRGPFRIFSLGIAQPGMVCSSPFLPTRSRGTVMARTFYRHAKSLLKQWLLGLVLVGCFASEIVAADAQVDELLMQARQAF